MKSGHFYWISYVVLVCFTFETGVCTAASWLPKAVTNLTPQAHAETIDDAFDEAVDTAFGPPFLDNNLIKNFPVKMQFEPGDRVLDQDPFFLRAQGWQQMGAAPEEGDPDAPSFLMDDTGVSVLLPGSSKAWRLNSRLEPLLSTNEYLFFTARDADFFTRKTPSLENSDVDNGGGVFVVALDDLSRAYEHSDPVPIFFFPLLGDGWDFGIRAYDEPALSAVHFVDAGDEVVTVKTRDIEKVIQTERINLELAQIDAARLKLEELKRDGKFMSALKDFSAESQNFMVKDQEKGALDASGLEDVVKRLAAAVDDDYVFPGRGATAGFGILFTGYDLDRSDKSLLITRQTPLLKKVWDWIAPKSAVAGDDGDDPSDPRKILQGGYSALAQMLTILGYLSLFAVVTRYAVPSVRTLLRKNNDAEDQRDLAAARDKARLHAEKIAVKMAKREGRPYVEPTADEVRALERLPNQDSLWHRLVRRERRALVSNLAYSMLAFWQIPTQTFGAAVGTFADRYLTRYATAPSKLLRWLFEKTILYSKNVWGNSAVNEKSFGQALIINGVDTGCYAWQLVSLIRQTGLTLATMIDPISHGAAEALHHTYGQPNPMRDQQNFYDITSTAGDGILKGAPSLSAGVVDFQTQGNLGRVRDQMIRDGLDPRDPRNAAEFKKRMDEIVDSGLESYGLPSRRNERAWDFNSVLGRVKDFLGYTAPENMRLKEDQTERKFVASFRPGMIYPVLKEARDYARDVLKQDPQNQMAREALGMFEDLMREFGVLRSALAAPIAALKDAASAEGLREKVKTFKASFVQNSSRFRRVRQELVLLTAEGDEIAPTLQVIDEWSQRVSEAGAAWAAHVYTAKFVEVLTGKDVRVIPTAEEVERYGGEADRKVLEQMKALFVGDFLQGVDLRKQHRATFEILKERQIVNMAKADEERKKSKEKKYEYEHLGWFGRWQKARAYRRAQNRFLKEYGRAFDGVMHLPGDQQQDERSRWNRVYGEEYAGMAGLVPDFTANPALKNAVVQKAEFLATREESFNEPLKAELNKLMDEGRYEEYEDLRATQYAKNFVLAYEDSTSHANWRDVPAVDPSRPGRLQKFRQRKWVRSKNPLSETLTVGCRLLEASTIPNHRLGLNALLDRHLWGFYDFKLAFVSMLKNFPSNALPVYYFRKEVFKNVLPRELWLWYHPITNTGFRMGNQYTFRVFNNLGAPPAGRMRYAVLFGVFVSFATSWSILFQQPTARWFKRDVMPKLDAMWDVMTLPITWTKSKFGCDVLDNCPEAPIVPESDAKKARDTVKIPVFSDGEGDPTEMDRMWEPDHSSATDFAHEWVPVAN